MNTPKLNTIISQIGFTWRPAYIVYKDNDTFLFSVKEETMKTTYTFTGNYRNCMVFEDFEAAYSWIAIYNYSSWAIDNSNNTNENAYKLFVMPIEIKGNGNKLKRRMLAEKPLINSSNGKQPPSDT